jgi:hypothetical protein
MKHQCRNMAGRSKSSSSGGSSSAGS